VRVLTGLSREAFEQPDPSFIETKLAHRRAVVFLAPEEQRGRLEAMLNEGLGLREATIAEIKARVPALKDGYAVAAAIEEDAFDMDVAGLHQAYLRRMAGNGGVLALRSRTGSIKRERAVWHVETSSGAWFEAPVIVNAAGAWGDVVAAMAGVRGIGLVPKRRTGVIIDPQPWDARDWPLVNDVDHTWYARTEARTKLMVSPADETDMTPHDVQPDELDVAIAIDRMQQALDIEVRRVEHAWAGLRTFAPDRTFVIGFDPGHDGFFWCVGQGGYGIQTAPAAGRLVADLIAGRDPGPAGAVVEQMSPARFASR
jgi:D-arginine dehydrogenase